MRDLFLSERRYIRNILMRHNMPDIVHFDRVLTEQYSPPRTSSRTRFNLDYHLQFVEDKALKGCKSFCASVLPNVSGADVFVTLDQSLSRVLRTELLFGEAFSSKYFTKYIQDVERELRLHSIEVSLRRSSYCRLFVIEDDACFLVFPDTAVPQPWGEKRLLRSGENSTIECYFDADRLVCIDGWFRTHTPTSEWMLAAEAASAEEVVDEESCQDG